MAIVKFPHSNLSIKTHGVIGRPWGAGRHTVGYTYTGDDFEYAGVYQRRPRITGQILVKMKHYRSPNPRTDKQQAWRGYFADVKLVWDDFTPVVKDVWRTLLVKKGMGGWNTFASVYMKRKPSDAGVMRAGLCECGYLTF